MQLPALVLHVSLSPRAPYRCVASLADSAPVMMDLDSGEQAQVPLLGACAAGICVLRVRALLGYVCYACCVCCVYVRVHEVCVCMRCVCCVYVRVHEVCLCMMCDCVCMMCVRVCCVCVLCVCIRCACDVCVYPRCA